MPKHITLVGFGIILLSVSWPSYPQESSPPIEVAPIQILAQPPDPEFGDEFKLPPNPSKELITARNNLDREIARLQALGSEIEKLTASADFDNSTAQDVITLRLKIKQYKNQIKFIKKKEESFRNQLVVDNDKSHNNIPQGPGLTEAELNNLDDKTGGAKSH